ncbi:MAG: chemotaxis protein CheX [Lachnospiraceae bacterium]|nr:chemotaxis protein CheX [Lachnospiraceae bacterium]
MVSYLLGNYMVKVGLMTKAQFEYVLSVQEKIRVKLGLIAVSEGMLTLDQADAINRMQQVMDKRFGDIAVEMGYLTDAQVGSLLKMQGNEYLTFAQTLVDENFVTMDKLQMILKNYQEENGFTNTEMEAIKSGDPEKIAPLFLPAGAEEYTEVVSVALKTMIRCINRHVYPMRGKLVDSASLIKPVTQELEGVENWKVGFADEAGGLCTIASAFAKEDYKVVDEDAQDAVGEFLNCVNGIFATAKSNQNIALELMPPMLGESASVTGKDILVMPFGIRNTTVNFVVTNKNGWR